VTASLNKQYEVNGAANGLGNGLDKSGWAVIPMGLERRGAYLSLCNVAAIFIFMVLYDFCVLCAYSCNEIVRVWNFESRMLMYLGILLVKKIVSQSMRMESEFYL
jgi:hypothetical protein